MEPISPEPVTDGAKVVAAVVGIVGAIATILAIVGVTTTANASGVTGAAAIIGTSVVTLIGIITPIWKAKQVRELVAPMVNVAALLGPAGTVVAGPAAPIDDGQPVAVVAADHE